MLPSVTNTITQEPPTRFLKVADLMERTRMSRASVYALVRRGILPEPVKMGHRSRWIEADVEAALVAMRSGFEHVITTRPVTRRPKTNQATAQK